MSHYQTLGVAQDSPELVIKAAYRALIRAHHPDAGGDPAAATRINEAYRVLSNTQLRLEYDRSLVPPRSSQPTAPSRSPEPEPRRAAAEPRLLRGDVDPPRRWWRAPAGLTAFALAAASVGIAVPFAEPSPWLIATIALGIVLVTLTSFGRSQAWFALLAMALVSWPGGVAVSMMAVALAAVAAGIGVLRMLEQLGWERYIADVVIATSNQPGVDMFFVGGTEGLVKRLRDGEWMQRVLSGEQVLEGYCAAITDTGVVLAQAPEAHIIRASRRRSSR